MTLPQPPAMPAVDRQPTHLLERLKQWRAGLIAAGQSTELADWIIREIHRTWRIEFALRMACEVEAKDRRRRGESIWGQSAIARQMTGAEFLLKVSKQTHDLPFIDMEKPTDEDR